ncbi:hypothetical protein ABFX02_06G175500 [Erythranthe guttata]
MGNISSIRIFRRRIKTPAAAEIFPEEIIAEILSRLPVKSLLKFRCVSKSWRSLISDKHFIKSHLQISRKDTNFTRHWIIQTFLFENPIRKQSLKRCYLPSLFSGLSSDPVEIDFPIENYKGGVWVVDSCNGLVCISINDGRHFLLWNPSTRKYKKLADVDDDDDDRMKLIIIYGFGFDESSDDYKVFCGFSNRGRGGTIAKIYSLRTDSWKRIEFLEEDNLGLDATGKFVSGKLHWGRRNNGPDYSNWDVFSFDLGTGVCGNVAQPLSYVETGFSPSLSVLDGCLCVLYNSPRTSVDVWIMKEYGVSESWVRIVTVPYMHLPLSNPSIHTPSLCVGPKGEILFKLGSDFLIYSPNDNRFRCPKMRSFGAFLEAGVYCESLVSLV